MKRLLLSIACITFGSYIYAQEGRIKFSEYDLPNGLHVILHEDHTTPIVSVSVLYHVGSKNEDPQRTGFAHFFEHLMFEGSDNIARGEYAKLISSNGGVNNAHTTQDITYYYENMPSNQEELALWMESERMLHLKIDSTGIETQRKVVKEEKKQRFDNTPYGPLMNVVFENSFKVYPYKWSPIGTDQYIDMARYSEFMDFYKTFYVPNNAVLVVAGDINANTKEWVEKYFGSIPKGTQAIPRPTVTEPVQTSEQRAKFVDKSIQYPAVVFSYHTPKMGDNDYYAIQLLNQLLSQGESSRLQKQLVDKDEVALDVGAFSYPLEAAGLEIIYAIASQDITADQLEKSLNKEIERIKSSGVTDEEFTKLQNQAESDFVMQNSNLSGIAENLATDYTFYRNTNYINTELEKYQKITKDDIKKAANKYFTKDNRTVLYYLPQ